MPKISKQGGPTIKGSTATNLDMTSVVTLGMLSRVLDHLGLSVYIEGPSGIPIGSCEPVPPTVTGTTGIWIGSRSN